MEMSSLPSSAQPRRLTLRDRITALRARIDWRSYFYGLGAMIIIGGGYLYFTSGSGQTTATSSGIATVSKQTIVTSISAAGTVTFSSEQTLKFNQRGKVTKVNVQQGDKVKEGDIIAELDESSVLADIRQAELSIGASALQMEQQQALKDQTITDAQNAAQQAEQAAQQAQSNLEISKQKLPSDLAAAKQAVQEKQAALDQAKLDQVQNLANTVQSELGSSDGLLDSFYDILTLHQGSRPQQSTFGVNIDQHLFNNVTNEQQVQTDFLNAENASNQMHNQYGATLATQTNLVVLNQALSDTNTLSQSLYTLGEDVYVMLQGATTDYSTFTASQLTSLRSTVNSNRSTAKQNLTPSVTLSQKSDAVTNAQHALEQAQNDLALLQTQNPVSLQQQQDALKKAQDAAQSQQETYNQTSKNTDIGISLKQNDVSQKVAALDKLRVTLQDYQLTAPFDGVITHIDYKVGDNLLDTGDTENVVLQNPDYIVVTIPLDQVDVVHVKTGLAATIAFDAVPGQEFQGSIDSIDPVPVSQSGVVSYNVQIKLPTPKDLNILSGMTATVSIETGRKENVLAVPNLSLKTTGNTITVQKSTGESVVVTTGLTDGQYTEILSGLSEGDKIASVNIPRTASSSSGGNSALNLLRLGGGGGGGFGGPPTGGTARTGGAGATGARGG